MFLKYLLFGLVLLSFWSTNLSAQEYSDFKPVYRPWTRNYILDKIDFKKDRTIFYFRSMCQHHSYNRATFYPAGGKYAWYLIDKKTGEEYNLLEIRNLAKNGQVEHEVITEETTIMADMKSGKPYTIFTCEVHFPKLPASVTLVDFIEGRGGESKRNHYNCFDVQIKPQKDKNLGKKEDSEQSIREFEERFSGKKTEKEDSKPKVEKENKPSNGPARELQTEKDLACGQNLILTGVQFKDNSPEFSALVQARQSLDLILEYMKAHPQSELLLEGHTDIFGKAERNKKLSYERALAVQKYLSGMGIPPHRIRLEWYGSEKPLYPEGNAKNRRVEARLSCE